MRPSTPFRSWIQRALRLGPSRLALGLAILLALVTLALPLWSLGWVNGTDQEISSFSWNEVTTVRYEGGSWRGTEILPYASTGFPTVATVLGTSYILVVAFAVLLIAVFALFSLEYGRTMPTLSLLVISLLVVGVALLALFYPIVAISGAATTDVGTFTVGFWGSTRTTGPTRDWAWGPGLGWWLLLVAVLLGVFGVALPYLRSIRGMAVPTVPQRAPRT